jgi:alginate O-acetyltransferase complex protein AlgI
MHREPVAWFAIVLPIGISFFTFQALSYVIDVYRRETPVQRNPLDLMLYVALFPQLIAGPIVRYHDVAQQLHRHPVRFERFVLGVKRFIFGLSKKVLIANNMGLVADRIFAIPGHDLYAGAAWLGIAAYTLQIYFDFSGYSDMAIGLGRMFGFEFLENFRHPYVSQSITEFWRRWHISLSTWFRDYLYIPLGGNRVSRPRLYANLLIVFLLTGLWHGASWTFVAWGLYHGMFLIAERVGGNRALERAWRPVRHAYAVLAAVVGWVIFRSETFGYAAAFLRAMAGFGTGDPGWHPIGQYWNAEIALILALGCLFSTPIYAFAHESFERYRERARARGKSGSIEGAWGLAGAGAYLGLMGLSVLELAGSSYNPFIYFRF